MHLLFRVVSHFSILMSDPYFLRRNTCFICWNPVLPWFIRTPPHVVRNWGEKGLGCREGLIFLVRVFNWACSLTCQPDPRFRIPVWILFPQGTGDPISADHSWLGPRNNDWTSTVYPPLYLQKGFFPFIWHDSTQLQEYYQGFHT